MFQCFWSCHYLAYFVTHLMDICFAVDFFFWTLSGEANNQILRSFFNVSYWPGLSLVKIIKYYGCLDNKGGASQRAIVRPPAPKRAPPTLPTQGPITPQTQTHLPKHTHTLKKTDTPDSLSDVPESWVWLRADFQSGSRMLKKVFWTFSYLYLWHTMWFHAKKLLKTLKFWK